jgi:hypothetical protein
VLELAGDKREIPFVRFLAVGAACTILPLFVVLATLLIERRMSLF